MKFLFCKILILSYFIYLVYPLNTNKDESTTLYEMFGKIRKNNSKLLRPQNLNQYSFKEKHRKSKFLKDDPAGPGQENKKEDGAATIQKNYVIDLNDANNVLEDWFTIKSNNFHSTKFPIVKAERGTAGVKLGDIQRINENFATSKVEGAISDKFFWFKLKSGYIYYFATKNDINALDAILIKRVEDYSVPQVPNIKLPTCIWVYDFQDTKFEICTLTLEMKLKWLCSIQNLLKNDLDDRCLPKREFIPDPVIVKDYKQIIVIPVATKNCNEGWNYVNKGSDWECICKEGISQSPLDLPEKSQAVATSLMPMFTYERVNVNAEESSIDGLIEGGRKINIRYEKHAIRIFHPNMGKIVGIDGSVYVAEEIVFHTPSEHKINGQQFDMEMQVIHYGRTKGDIANQVVLSILFKNSPGHYNKFLDKIDFFNLPNPIDTAIELQHDFFIPSVFLDSDAEDIMSMEPFSFFNYEGSLTTPPCTERTTYYVTADPIPLSNTVIQLFKEALNRPERVERDEATGNIVGVQVDVNINENNRDTQAENGRTIYLFDHILNGCITYSPPKRTIQKAGHYEKVTRTADEFIFVTGNTPTGIPGSFVVSEREAKGKLVKEVSK